MRRAIAVAACAAAAALAQAALADGPRYWRASELGVSARVTFVQGDAADYVAEPGAFGIASCIGATWIGGGLAGTVDLLRPAIRHDGRSLIGEPLANSRRLR